MDDVRSGNMSVVNMKKEIVTYVENLKLRCPSKRAQRQLVDAANFLEMIAKPPYNRCKTVSKLKEAISQRRNELKDKVAKVDFYIPGHQFTLFEKPKEITEKEQAEFEKQKQILLDEIRWLHKCLGMCSSRSYFY